VLERRFRLAAGPVDLDVYFRAPSMARLDRFLSLRAGPFVDRGASDGARVVRCDIEVTGPEWQPYQAAAGERGPVAQRVTRRTWFSQWCYYRGAFGVDQADVEISDRDTAIEHALRAAVVFASMPADALFFHAATLVYDGEAVLLPGHPNAGKSTIAREGHPDRVISNEISICVERDGRWWALPSPFWGSGDLAQWAEPAPLRGVAVLTQAKVANAWAPLRGAAAVAALMPHVGAQAAAHLAAPEVLQRVADFTGALRVASLAWHRASHPLEGSPWKQ